MIDRPVSPTSDISLLLRAHAEQRWLSHEVLPVLRQLEQRDCLPEEQLGAALAYLEVLWIEASQRAAETDAAQGFPLWIGATFVNSFRTLFPLD